ncbi:hypothetical protein [Bradyrhizobium prioriisuperbiae]|nr:hypothetical protein [Bradyrhizobium prioritasuperba]
MFQRALLIAAITAFASAHAIAWHKLESAMSATGPSHASLSVTGD